MPEAFCTRYKKAEWKGPYVSISWDLFQFLLETGILTYGEVCVYIFIAGNERNKNRDSRVSVRYIAQGMGCSEKTAHTSLKKLVELGLVENVRKGIYRTVLIEDFDAWKKSIIKKVINENKKTVVKTTTKDCGKNYYKNRSKNYHKGVVKNTTNTRNINFYEINKRSVCEEGNDTHTPAFNSSKEENIQNGTVIKLQPKTPEQDPLYQELVEELQVETNLACLIKNPVVYRKFFQGNWEFPTSYIPPTADDSYPHLISRLVFLKACNLLCDIQKKRKIPVYVLPVTETDVIKLGDVLSSFLPFEDWEDRFSDFMDWVYENKSNYSFNFLSGHLQDWASHRSQKTVRNIR